MCGISGVVGQSLKYDPPESLKFAQDMATSLTHRGPDATKTIANDVGTAYLGMNTLLIVNPSGQTGPYCNSNKGVMLTFNGEIYNFKALAEEWGLHLQENATDAEVILAGYEKFGTDFVHSLDGMFAIAIVDNRLDK